MHTTPPSEHDLRTYRDQLQELAHRLTGVVAVLVDEGLRPTGADGTAAEGPARPAVVTSSAGDEEVARSVLVSEEHTLTEVRSALARLDAKTFGICERCDRPVSKARLAVVPYARYCIRCAREAGDAPAPE